MTIDKNKIIYALIAIIVILLMINNCRGKRTVKVSTPEVKGTLHDTIKVTYTKIIPVEKIVVKNVPYEVVKEVKVNGETVFVHEIDTIRTQAFTKSLEDDKLKLTASGVVTGEINDIKFDYTIKPQTLEIPAERKKRFGIGVFAGYDIYGKPNAGVGITYNPIRF